ncbi:MAG: D-alanyl-D-alanine carboxypeptidase family protein [Candidatus Limnocylindria bacterium]
MGKGILQAAIPVIRRALLLPVLIATLASGLNLSRPELAAAANPFTDIGNSQFEADIDWLYSSGITRGCAATRFCPEGTVTRGEMAAFLVRMFHLPAGETDFFSDDAHSMFEDDINALARSGITGGCGSGRYCPDAFVTREQMAAFLVRATRAAQTDADYFLDDERSQFEAVINRFAAAGMTSGCGEYRFCPTSRVTRGEMAAFLHRVEEPRGAPPVLPDNGPLPSCSYQDVLTEHRAAGDWPRTLLDPIYMVPSSYVPPDLVSTASAGINGGYTVRSVAIPDLRGMADAARVAGIDLRIYSAYRSYATQQAVFARKVAELGYEAALLRSARPGHSEHQLGTTIDVSNTPGAWAWLADNAWRYGWVMSYPSGKTSVTCYIHEPWHYRYVGRERAASIRASGLTLREYLWRIG